MSRVLVLLVSFVAASCGGSGPPALVEGEPPSDPATIEATLLVDDQTTDGTVVEVAQITISATAGYLVLHADADGSPGGILATEPVAEGTTADVRLEPAAPLSSGPYWVMVHRDAGVEGVFEFPGPDEPVRDDGEIVMQQIALTVEG